MPDWVYSLPDDAITALVIAIVVGGEVLAALACRILVPGALLGGSGGSLVDSYRLVVSLTALVLAFSLLQAQTNIREINALLTREASTLDILLRELQHFDSPAAAELRARLVAYGQAVVTDEWPLLARRRHSPRLDQMSNELSKAVAAIEPRSGGQQSLYGSVIANLDLLAYLRDERISAARIRLPASFWHAIEALTLVVILLAAAGPTTLRFRLNTLLPSAALAVLIALVIIIDVPFQGQSAIRPVQLQQVLEEIGTAVPPRR